MVIDACAQKARVAEGILLGAILKIPDHFWFGVRPGESQLISQAEAFRNTGEQIVDRFCANRDEHRVSLGRTLREIAHQCDASLAGDGMYAS